MHVMLVDRQQQVEVGCAHYAPLLGPCAAHTGRVCSPRHSAEPCAAGTGRVRSPCHSAP